MNERSFIVKSRQAARSFYLEQTLLLRAGRRTFKTGRQHVGHGEQHARAPTEIRRYAAAVQLRRSGGSAGLHPAHAGMLPACLCDAQDLFARFKSFL
jgi:hypothetical protein